MQIVQVQLWLATLFSNFPTGSTNIPYGKSAGLFSSSSCTSFLLATVWGAPWAQAQLKNRMEGSGKWQLTGEPTFLTQVPKQSDANTPSALSIAFIDSLLRVPSPFGEGALRRQCAVNLGTFEAWIKGTTPGGSSHSPAFAEPIGNRWLSQLPATSFVLFFFASLSPVGFSARMKSSFSPLVFLCHPRNESRRVLGMKAHVCSSVISALRLKQEICKFGSTWAAE